MRCSKCKRGAGLLKTELIAVPCGRTLCITCFMRCQFDVEQEHPFVNPHNNCGACPDPILVLERSDRVDLSV